jgi:hypothetical protein
MKTASALAPSSFIDSLPRTSTLVRRGLRVSSSASCAASEVVRDASRKSRARGTSEVEPVVLWKVQPARSRMRDGPRTFHARPTHVDPHTSSYSCIARVESQRRGHRACRFQSFGRTFHPRKLRLAVSALKALISVTMPCCR